MTTQPVAYSGFGEYCRYGLFDVRVGTPVMVRMPRSFGVSLRIETITHVGKRNRFTSDGSKWSVNGMPWGAGMPIQARCEEIVDYQLAREVVRRNEAANDLGIRRERLLKRIQVAYAILDLIAVTNIEKELDEARNRAFGGTITGKVAE